jgi:HAMP domain-containing protein
MPTTPDDNVRALNGLCEQIETAIARGELPDETVSDLKKAIDDTRTRVWTSMEAAKSGDPAWVQEFWLQRAAEVCLKMVQRLERGELDHRSPGAGDLRAAAERLASSLTPRRGGP